MIFLRISLYILALLFTLVLGGGFYVYTQFPTLADTQARKYLSDYGVQELKYKRLILTSSRLQLDELRLTGSMDEIHYRANVSRLEVNFKWKDLSEAKLVSIKAAHLELNIADNSTEVVKSIPLPSLKFSSFLSHQYLALLPVKLINIQHWNFHYVDSKAMPIKANGSLKYDQQLTLSVNTLFADNAIDVQLWTQGAEQYPSMSAVLTHLDSEVARVSATLEPESGNRWLWSSDGEVNYSTFTNAIISANESLNLQLDLSILDQLQVQGHTRFDLKVHHNNEIQLIPQTLDNLIPQFEIEAETNNQLIEVSLEKQFHNLSGELAISATLNEGLFDFTLSPATVDAKLIANPNILPKDMKTWLKWNNTIPVLWNNPDDIRVSSKGDGSWTAQLHKNTVRIGGKQSLIHFQDLNVTANYFPSKDSLGKVELDTHLITRLRRSQLPALKLSAQLEGRKTDTRFKFTLDDIAQSMSAAANGRGNFSTGVSNVELHMGSEDLNYASETMLPLLHSLELLSSQIDPAISGGRFKLSSNLESKSFELQNIKLESELNIARLSGDYDSYSFDDAALHAKWTGIDLLETIEPVELSVAKLHLGIELRDTQINLLLPEKTPLSQPTILINQFSSKVFGGEVFLAEPKQWDFGAKSNNFNVRAKGWQLSDMVALQQDEDIHAQGTLEGQLPIELTAGRLIIAKGYLRAVAPGGTIRYIANEAGEALAASNPELELALDLLSDFQFHVLSSEVELDNKGKLLLGLSLRGKNPTQFDGRPINFNINLEQNLDPLLQSLRLSDKLVEQLKSRVH